MQIAACVPCRAIPFTVDKILSSEYVSISARRMFDAFWVVNFLHQCCRLTADTRGTGGVQSSWVWVLCVVLLLHNKHYWCVARGDNVCWVDFNFSVARQLDSAHYRDRWCARWVRESECCEYCYCLVANITNARHDVTTFVKLVCISCSSVAA